MNNMITYNVHMKNISIGPRIKEIRKSRRLTQGNLAELVGKERSMVCRYERGQVDIPVSVLVNLAAALDVTPGEFFNGTSSDAGETAA